MMGASKSSLHIDAIGSRYERTRTCCARCPGDSEAMGIVQIPMLAGAPYTALQNAIWAHPAAAAAEAVASVFGAVISI